MRIDSHDKKYDGLELIETTITLTLLPDEELDDILYRLIAAQQKLEEKDTNGYELRLWSAQEKLNKLIKANT